MTYWIAAMRAAVHKQHDRQPHRQLPSMLQLGPSRFAHFYEALRRLVLACILFGIGVILLQEGASLYRQASVESDLSEYRVGLRDVANTIRAMRAKAVSEKHPFELRIDQKQGSFTVASLSGKTAAYVSVERVVWLPEGLEISEAPLWITAESSGLVTPASIVVEAPAFRRLFRLTTHLGGVVEFHEEPTS